MGKLFGCLGTSSSKKKELARFEERLEQIESELAEQAERTTLDADQNGKITEAEYQAEIERLRQELSDTKIKLDECQTLVDYLGGEGIPRTIDVSSETIRKYVDEKIVADGETNFGWFPDSIEAKTWTVLFKEMLVAAGGMKMDIAGHTLEVNITHDWFQINQIDDVTLDGKIPLMYIIVHVSIFM